MKFLKLQLNHHTVDDKVQWRLCLENSQDVRNYSKIDAEKIFTAYLHSDNEKHPPEGRLSAIMRLLDCTRRCLKEGEVMYPMLEIANICDNKIIGMEKVLKFSPVLVNMVGGYCDLHSFIKQWNCTILEEIVTDGIGFPVEIKESDVLVLENNSSITMTVSDYLKFNNITDYTVIPLLKEVDSSLVKKAIIRANTIIIESQFLDNMQNENFLMLFNSMPKKRIVLFSTNFAKIKQYSLFKEVSEKHEIIFG